MRPVLNLKHGYFQVGDIWKGKPIIRLVRCQNRSSCQQKYRNFEIACGGYERVIDVSTSHCPFFYCLSNPSYLTDREEGEPLL